MSNFTSEEIKILSDEELKRNAESEIDYLFYYLFSFFPASHSLFNGEDGEFYLSITKNNWTNILMANGIIEDSGIIERELLYQALGDAACLNQIFMPSCGQFLALCRKYIGNKDDTNQG